MNCHPVFGCSGHNHTGNDLELSNILIKSITLSYIGESLLPIQNRLDELDIDIENKLDDLDNELGDRINDVDTELGSRLDWVDIELGKIPLVAGKIPDTKVSTVDGSTQDLKNAMYSLELAKQKLDTGITVTAKSGGVARTQAEKNFDSISIEDFGLIADGVADDSTKLQGIESTLTDTPIDMLGKTIKATFVPSNNKFYNGQFDIAGVVRPARYVGEIHADDNLIAIGKNAGAAHTGTQGVRNCIAIGQDAMKSNTKGRHNIALGVSSLHYLNGTDRGGILGTRNIAIGGNTGRFMTNGYGNIIMGRDSGHSLADISNKVPLLNVIIGTNAVMGDSPNILDFGEIENHTPSAAARNVVVGTQAGFYLNADDSVIIGYKSGYHSKQSYGMTAIGAFSFENHEQDRSPFGNKLITKTVAVIYTQSATKTIRLVSSEDHGVTNGGKIQIRFNSGVLGDKSYNDTMWFHNVNVINSTTLEIQSPVVDSGTGVADIYAIDNLEAYTSQSGDCVGIGYKVGNGTSNYRSVGVGFAAGAKGLGVENVAIGHFTFTGNTPSSGNVAVGAFSQETSTGSANTAVGAYTLNKVSGTGNTAVGASSSKAITTGKDNTSVGGYSLLSATTANKCTALGVASLRYTVAGEAHNYNNATGVGNNTRVSGNNQVQLGDSTTTTYAFGAVQDRSDARDKIVEGGITDAHIDFFNAIEFMRYRLDYRDDYIVSNEDGTVTNLVKDGSKSRKREHVGVIAQQVEQAMQAHNVDFAGLQHHEHNGGEDVYTIGYQEFIPILGEIVQRQQKQIDELKALVGK